MRSARAGLALACALLFGCGGTPAETDGSATPADSGEELTPTKTAAVLSEESSCHDYLIAGEREQYKRAAAGSQAHSRLQPQRLTGRIGPKDGLRTRRAVVSLAAASGAADYPGR